MSKLTLLEVYENGVVGIRIAKTTGDGPAGFHRTSVLPGQDPNEVIAAVNADLTNMGIEPVETWAPATAMVAATHTAEVVKQFQAARATAAAIAPAPVQLAGNATAAAAGP